jgi:asparagine synthase (glutamine-hydrolysing)
MVLSGDGGDEAFAGYDRYRLFQNHERLGWLLNRLIHRRGDWPLIVRLLGRRGWSGFSRELDAWLSLMNYVPDRFRAALWRPEFRAVLKTPNAAFETAAARANGCDPVAFGQLLDFETYLPGDILTKVDVASMAHGLEVRTPLIDRRVAELAARIPLNQRLDGDGGKRLPKQAVARRFPSEFVNRKKMGFFLPRDQWLKRSQPLRKLLDERLTDRACRIHSLLDPQAVRRMVRCHDWTGRFSTPIWPVLVLMLWLEQNPEISFQ